MGCVTSTQTREDPSLYPVLIEHEARYSDLDPSRRIGRDALVRWFEDARVAVERDAFGADLVARLQSRVRLLLAAVRVDVIAPLRVAGNYRIGIGVSHIGASSFAYRYAVFAGHECVATGESVSVHCDVPAPPAADGDHPRDGTEPSPLPDVVRGALATIQVSAPAPTRPDRGDARLVRENYPFRVDVRTRFGDLDTNRHVNNVALAGWYLDGLAELHQDVLGYPTGGPLDGLSPSSLAVQYRDQVHYPGIYQLRVGVLELDEDTVRYACGLFDGPRCIGLAEAEGRHHAPGQDGDPVRLAEALAPFRMRNL
ncbi:acyl-CoA thioester hydrolase [Pseudonocardia endophytica]|uniref:Acyl-CoA thioester hydrolase n=1 Tax=Pseudonocardia endophytica TaxID=401976 RepID=A0A4V2PIV4_PSEEN|nr:acyl-CoA thioester hydrolase [Pseudonocardia endophytica]